MWTETEMNEKKDRVEDALHATKAAVEEGIVPGGGIALLNAREACIKSPFNNIGAHIVYEACSKPFEQILSNAGWNDKKIMNTDLSLLKEKGNWNGVDIKKGDVINLKEKGIIDPTKVTRAALENAAAVAGTVLLTECVVVNDPEEKENNQQQMNPMMGM